MAIFKKRITAYFPYEDLPIGKTSATDSPATEFLREVVDICDSIQHCKRTFTRKKDNTFTKDSLESFALLNTSAFAMLMSHFETFQKAQFAKILNARFFFKFPDELELASRLEKEGCDISLTRVLAGGGDFGETGQIISDAMPGWHNPKRVNRYFRALFPDRNFFSNDLIQELTVLWQLRHSIVHTGATITREDAMRTLELSQYGARKLEFGEEFMPAIGRRFHLIIQFILDPLISWAKNSIIPIPNEPEEDRESTINSILGYASSRKSWFRK